MPPISLAFRLLSSADPIEETTLAAHRMSTLSKDPVYGQWARDTAASLGPAGAAVLDVMDSAFVQVSDLTRSWPDPGASFGESLDGILPRLVPSGDRKSTRSCPTTFPRDRPRDLPKGTSVH